MFVLKNFMIIAKLIFLVNVVKVSKDQNGEKCEKDFFDGSIIYSQIF